MTDKNKLDERAVTYCPFCGSKKLAPYLERRSIDFLEEQEKQKEKQNKDIVWEHQCCLCCRSFWT